MGGKVLLFRQTSSGEEYKGGGVGDGLSMITAYTQVDILLGLHLRYSHIL